MSHSGYRWDAAHLYSACEKAGSSGCSCRCCSVAPCRVLQQQRQRRAQRLQQMEPQRLRRLQQQGSIVTYSDAVSACVKSDKWMQTLELSADLAHGRVQRYSITQSAMVSVSKEAGPATPPLWLTF